MSDSFATLDKLVDKFTLPPAALPIGDASLTHVIKLAAHSSASSTPAAMRQLFIMTPYKLCCMTGACRCNEITNVTAGKKNEFMSDFFCDSIENEIVYRVMIK
jgi:hypothetical protein